MANGRLTDFNKVLKMMVMRAGWKEVYNVTSQGLKSTCLSFCAKFGLPESIRGPLGYHKVHSGSAAVRSYARDRLMMPVKKLTKVLLCIHEGTFNPDANLLSLRMSIMLQDKYR